MKVSASSGECVDFEKVYQEISDLNNKDKTVDEKPDTSVELCRRSDLLF